MREGSTDKEYTELERAREREMEIETETWRVMERERGQERVTADAFVNVGA